MRDFAWFRLMIVGIGLLIVGVGLPDSLGIVISRLRDSWMSWGTMFAWTVQGWFYLVEAIPHVLQLAFGLFLVVRSKQIARHFIRGTVNRCAGCDFDLSGLVRADVCPECGTPLPPKPVAPS